MILTNNNNNNNSSSKSKMVAEASEIVCKQSSSICINLVSITESVVSCTTTIKTTLVESSTKFTPSIRSGSHTDIGPRKSNEDEHIRINDLSNQLGSEAASYLKEHAMKFFHKIHEL
ncbi:probable protein phosphatase 2C 49 [Tanacetum coccineum]